MIQEHITLVKRFSGGERDYASLEQAAQVEGEGVFYPTDVVLKANEVVGCFSVGAMPTVLTWLSKRLTPRDSLQSFNTIENVIQHSGAPGILLPCKQTSPLYLYVEKLGYQNLGLYNIFFKRF